MTSRDEAEPDAGVAGSAVPAALSPVLVAHARRVDGRLPELLPAPGELWWRVDGEAQCAEFRTGLLVRPVSFDESIEE